MASPLVRDSPVSVATETMLRVLVCLDGVPHGMMADLHARGRFRAFRPPARLISTFPAITEVMLTEFFRVEPPPGYGLRYYDEDANALRGGIGDLEAISVWFSLYDYVTPMLDRGLVYLWAPAAERDLTALERRLRTAGPGTLLMHLDSTDALMHHEKAEVTERWLVRLDELLERLGTAADSRVEIVFFSDHGNDRTRSRRVPLEAHLKARGWSPAGTIRGDSGVAILPTGLISTGYLYTRRPAEVAASLADLPGLDFALFDTGGAVHIVGPRGAAVIERRLGEGAVDAGPGLPGGNEVWWRYRALRGDPLALETAVARLTARGRMDAEGWARDSEWFVETIDEAYPDVLNRAWGGATGHVENVGDVLLSLKDGWHCGSRLLSGMLTFEGTHGSLSRASVTGFWMSSRRGLPDARAEDALDVLGWRDSVIEHAGGRGVGFRCAHGSAGDPAKEHADR